MNDRDLRKKKHSQTSLKSGPQKHLHSSNLKIGPICKPKQPPNISNHYLLQATKKKEQYARDIRNRDHDTLSDVDPRSFAYTRPPRISNGKAEEPQTKKKIKDLHNKQSKPHKVRQKLQNRENRQIRSNIDLNLSRSQKPSKTEAAYDGHMSLVCKQRFNKKNKKSTKNNQGASQQNSRLTSSQKTHKKTFAQQMADFEAKAAEVNAKEDSYTQKYLFQQEQIYSRIENYNCYLVKNHPEIPWFKRAIVINWMLEMCTGFGCKRESFALAVNYLDRYLTLTQNIPLQRLQLIAAGALSLSNKSEGQKFTISGLVECNDGFSIDEVIDMQTQILWKLGWTLHPPTSNMWANRIAIQWDMYLDHQEDLVQIMQQNLGCVKFKTMDIQGYHNFRSLMQYIDFSLMDVHTLQYHCRELAASFLYIILNIKLRIFKEDEIVQIFPKSSQYLLKPTEFNSFYCKFLKQSFGFSLQDLLPTVQYCATFLFLPLDFNLPLAVQGIEEQEDLDYSQFCSFQTCNQNYLQCLMKRNRQYD